MAKQVKESRCSFCGSSKQDTLMLIEGLDAYICDKCVVQANQLVLQEFGNSKSKNVEASLKLLKPLEI